MSKWFNGLLAAVVLSAVLVGCNKKNESNGANATAGSQASGPKMLHLAFITNNAADFWTIARAGCEKAKQETPNIDVDFQIPGDGTAATQKRIIDDLLARGIDGMSISPVDPANETPLLQQVAKQILLFCHDSDAPDSGRVCYVGTNNVAAGVQVGGLIKQALPNGGKIMLFVGTMDAQNARDRYNGIKQALKGSNVQILDVRTDDTDGTRATANARDTLVKYPDIAALIGLYSYNGPAIRNAVKAANKVGQVKIVCFDEDPDTLDGVKDGSIYATVVQQPFEFGREAIELMAKYLRGDKSGIPADGKLYIPTLAIEKDNVDAFRTKLNAQLGR